MPPDGSAYEALVRYKTNDYSVPVAYPCRSAGPFHS